MGIERGDQPPKKETNERILSWVDNEDEEVISLDRI